MTMQRKEPTPEQQRAYAIALALGLELKAEAVWWDEHSFQLYTKHMGDLLPAVNGQPLRIDGKPVAVFRVRT
jgi:hypothetical protein